MDPRIRQITIKTGVVKRLAKEKVSYEKEAQGNRNRIEKFKAVSSSSWTGYSLVKGENNVITCFPGGKRFACHPEGGGMSSGVPNDGS